MIHQKQKHHSHYQHIRKANPFDRIDPVDKESLRAAIGEKVKSA